MGVKLLSGARSEFLLGALKRHRGTVRAVARHRVQRVAGERDAARERDLLADQTVRIAPPSQCSCSARMAGARCDSPGIALLAVAGVMLGLAGTRAWGVSCPSSSLCVAVNGAGEVVTTRHPAFGRSAWTSAAVDGSNHLAGVSCPSPSLCVAADWAGNVVTSTDPAGGTGAWTVAHVDGANALSGISCPSVSLCVTVDEAGNALTSSNPAGVAGAWTSEAAARRTEH